MFSDAAMEGYRADERLVARAQAGDSAAFERLFERHQRRVYSLAMGMLHSVEDAEDVTQETFVNAYRSLPQLADGQAFHAWTTRIAVNLCRRRRARRQNALATLSLDAESAETGMALQVPDTAAQPHQVIETGELRRRVRDAIAGLPDEFRDVIALHELGGLKLEEVAQTLSVPLGTAKSRLSRGRGYLRRALAAYVHAVDVPRRLAPAGEADGPRRGPALPRSAAPVGHAGRRLDPLPSPI